MTRSLRVAALTLLIGGWGGSTAALARSGSRVVRYRGARIVVPASWPAYNLRHDPTACVRFDRHAVYLGTPGAAERCPAHAVGRTEAILLAPLTARAARGLAGAPPLPGRAAAVVQRRVGSVLMTATWRAHPAVIERALGVRRLRAAAWSSSALPVRLEARLARAAAPVARAASIYTGLGFDVCKTPSSGQMAAWNGSPYRAVGVYIGGANLACSQPSVTAEWVGAETAAGWHLIPTYVGLQAPGNSCGCAAINPGNAATEGAAAADDAIGNAQAVGIRPGNPIYFDMEAYSRTPSSTSTVLSFLSAWTATLHAAGYTSGVYSSAKSGISDLVAALGSSTVEPDDLWIADWNGLQSASDPYVPAADWAAHERLHQYLGGHNVTYGGVTLDIDSNYLDGATAGGSGLFPDGTFVEVSALPAIYRIAGGAPLLVSSWDAVGGEQTPIMISQEQFDELNPFPADRTFLVTSTGQIFRVAGGAPIAVSDWSVFGGPRSYVAIDQWDLDNITDPSAHLRPAPADGTVVEGFPSRTYWLFVGGNRSPTGPTAGAIGVDDAGLAPFPIVLGLTFSPAPAAVIVQCVVPRLRHLTVPEASRALRQAHCRLGKVHRPRRVRPHHVLRVVSQSPPTGEKHSLSYKVAVTVR